MRKKLSKIQITRLLVFIYMTLLIGFIIMRLIEYKNLQNVQAIMSTTVNNSIRKNALLIPMRKDADYVQVNVLRWLFYTDKEKKGIAEKIITAELNKNDSNLEVYQQLINDQQEKEIFGQLKISKNEYTKNVAILTQLIKEGKQNEAESFNSKFLATSFDNTHQSYAKLGDYITKRDNIVIQKNEKLLDDIEKINVWINGALFLLLLSLGITLSIVTKKIKTANVKLAESEYKYRSLVEHTNELINKSDKDGRIVFASNRFKEKLEFTDKELFSLRIPDILAEESQHQYRPNPTKSEVGEIITTTQKTFKSKSGKKIIVEGTVVLDYEKEIFTGATAYFNDITEKNQLHNNLLSSEEKYRQLFDFTPLPMWLYHPETLNILQVNKAAINNYGYSEKEFTNMTIMDIRPQEDKPKIKKIVNNLIQLNKIFNGEFCHLKKSGEKIDVHVYAIPVLINGEKRILATAMDITEKKLFEQKLTAAIIKTQEDERYELGGELHDNVCQILATSQFSLGMMKKSLPVELKEFFDQTQQYISLATTEIRDLSHRLAPAFFDDATLEDAFKNLLRTFNIENKYELNLYFDKDAKNYPTSHDIQLNLYRILQEQLRNISKHANASRIEVSVTINNDVLQMKIADNGIGFDIYGNKPGIGLANMNRRSQLFSGKFTIDSTVGNGCNIVVEIPLTNLN